MNIRFVYFTIIGICFSLLKEITFESKKEDFKEDKYEICFYYDVFIFSIYFSKKAYLF